MALELIFGGWFQARLATDPDPYDEPRGVSGSSWALPGEPDLDRIIRFQPRGAFERVECAPEIRPGVTILRVLASGRDADEHPLIGGLVELADGAKFEGRNGIVAEDALEPIVPMRIRVTSGPATFSRSFSRTYRFPFAELRGLGLDASEQAKAEIAAATGIDDLRVVWDRRRGRLGQVAARATSDPALAEACRYRIEFLRTDTTAAELSAKFFGRRVHYAIDLAGPREGMPPGPGVPAGAADRPWPLSFWMGGWDPDAQCGFVQGKLSILDAGDDPRAALPPGTELLPGPGHAFRP